MTSERLAFERGSLPALDRFHSFVHDARVRRYLRVLETLGFRQTAVYQGSFGNSMLLALEGATPAEGPNG